MSSLQSLAHFHALGFAMKKLNKIDDLVSQYPFLSTFFSELDNDKAMVELMNSNYQLFLTDLRETKYSDMSSKFEALAIRTATLLKEETDKEKDFVIHGDLWANNCLIANEQNVSKNE